MTQVQPTQPPAQLVQVLPSGPRGGQGVTATALVELGTLSAHVSKEASLASKLVQVSQACAAEAAINSQVETLRLLHEAVQARIATIIARVRAMQEVPQQVVVTQTGGLRGLLNAAAPTQQVKMPELVQRDAVIALLEAEYQRPSA